MHARCARILPDRTEAYPRASSSALTPFSPALSSGRAERSLPARRGDPARSRMATTATTATEIPAMAGKAKRSDTRVAIASSPDHQRFPLLTQVYDRARRRGEADGGMLAQHAGRPQPDRPGLTGSA